MAAKPAGGGLLPASIQVGRVRGIPIGLHYSWFIIASLITISLAAHFGRAHADWEAATIWSVSVATALLFFASLLAHELAHAMVAHAHGLPVRSITLFALGGIATIEKDAGSARTEFLVAVVGPIVSFTIGLGCLLVARSLGWALDEGTAGVTGAVLGWLGSINVLLAAFNLIPGYPLDGGRILRAVLWGIYNDRKRAARAAARVGQVVASMFIAWGLLQFVMGAGFGGLWLAFIGWFLFMAAQASYAEVSIGDALRDIRVADVMADDCVMVEPDLKILTLVDEVLLRTGQQCVAVRTDGRVMGLVTPHDVMKIERGRWADVPVSDVMRPLDTLQTVEPATPAEDALRSMLRDDVNQLPVVSEGRLQGIVSRGRILQLLQARAELSKAS